uniref:MATE family efflux transporter n=1 Tax=Clostridium sp. TaxID=1506 RepID=UPI0026073798
LIGTFIVFILLIINGKNILRIDLKEKLNLNKIKEISILGIPMSFQRVLFTLVNIILARIIGGFGSDAIAAQKIGLQIESIVYMVVGGLNGAISSFVGQNFGAKKYGRINEGYNKALIIGVIYALFVTLAFTLIPETLIKLFIREEKTIKIASEYLRIIGVSQIFSTIEMISNGVFTGVGKPRIPAFISIFFTVLRIPMAIILTRYIGVKGIWYAISISSILKGVISCIAYRVKIWRNYNNVKDN